MSVSSSSSQSTGLAGEFLNDGFEESDGRHDSISISGIVRFSKLCVCRRVRAGRDRIQRRTPCSRSRMPFTKRPESSEPKRLAISMASLMQTTGGTSLV